MSDINKQGKSGQIIGLSSEDHERINHLSREQMINIIETYYESANTISKQFTYPVGTTEVLGDRNRITDQMLGALQSASNLLWHEIMNAEITGFIQR